MNELTRQEMIRNECIGQKVGVALIVENIMLCFDVLWNSFWWFGLIFFVNADAKILFYSVLVFCVLLIGSLLHH